MRSLLGYDKTVLVLLHLHLEAFSRVKDLFRFGTLKCMNFLILS